MAPLNLREQRRIQDQLLEDRHRGFDLSAQDHHSKSERAHFAVVGEGTKCAQERYRMNYDHIDWSH